MSWSLYGGQQILYTISQINIKTSTHSVYQDLLKCTSVFIEILVSVLPVLYYAFFRIHLDTILISV
jgi:hypothetical protein